MAGIIRVHVKHRVGTTTLFFAKLPIRIGRDALNECQLGFPYVSRAHAVVERRDGRLTLRDVGSRFGTFAPSGVRLPAEQPIDLADVGFEFAIGEIGLRVEVADKEEG